MWKEIIDSSHERWQLLITLNAATMPGVTRTFLVAAEGYGFVATFSMEMEI
jgi:hypothetical protein